MVFDYLLSSHERDSHSVLCVVRKGLKAYFIVLLAVVIVNALYTACGGGVKVVADSGCSKNFMLDNQLLVILWAPIMEELSFRLGLSFKKSHVVVCTFFFFIFIGRLCLPGGYMTLNFYIRLLIALCSALITYRYVSKELLERIKCKNGKKVILLSALLFAIIHITNYRLIAFEYIFAYILLLTPRFLLGLVAGYYRLNIGFLCGLLFHVSLNAISIGCLLLSKVYMLH